MDSQDLLEASLCKELYTSLELSFSKIAPLKGVNSKFPICKENIPIPAPVTTPVLFSGASYARKKPSRYVADGPTIFDKEVNVIVKTSTIPPSGMLSTSPFKNKCDTVVIPDGVDSTLLQYRANRFITDLRNDICTENKSGIKYTLREFVKSIESYYQEQDNNQSKIVSRKRTRLKKRKQGDLTVDNSDIQKEENEPAWFPCKKCHFEFSTAKGLANHVKTHPKKMIEKNSCVYCRKCLLDEEALSNHLNAEHIFDITNFTCESCQVECISGDLFDKHQYFCHRNNFSSCFLCSNCDKVYYNEELYTFHKEQQKYCHICSLNFCMSSEQYKKHKAKHILHMYKCPKCNASFVTKAALTKHHESKNLGHSCQMKGCNISTESKIVNADDILDNKDIDDVSSQDPEIPEETNKNEKLHKCPICCSTFVRIKNLLSHVAAVHPQDVQDSSLQNLAKHECSKCDKRFTKKSNLVSHLATHIRDIGSNEDHQPKCSVCHKTFRLQRYLVDHMRLHTGRGTHQCHYCARKFLRISHLKLHMEMHDKSHKSHPCVHCNKKYMRKQDLMHHIRVKHNSSVAQDDSREESIKDEGFPCSTCSIRFPTTLKLRMHEVTHIVSKPPYKCLECSKEFMSLSVLKRHYLIHWDIKPFICTMCNRRFRYSQSLQRHMVTHTREKAHKCEHCGKCFALKGTLHIHMQQHNTGKIFTCAKCGDNFTNKREQKIHFCRYSASSESSDLNCGDYVFNKPVKYIDCGQIESNRNHMQSECVDDQLGNFVPNTTLSDMTEVTHLISDSNISDIATVAELVPSSMSNEVGQLIAQVSGNIVSLNESVPNTSFREMPPQAHKNSDLVEEILEQSNSPGTFDNSTILDGVSNIQARHENDVLSQAFAVMGNNIMTECVNFDTQTELQDCHEGRGTESTIYTLVSVDGDNSQPVLINIPSIDSAGTEENVTLQINFPDNGCSEVFIING